jgi:heme-degrading monooxygenase HmoA
MVTIGMNYKVLPGKGETFVNACQGVIRAMNGMNGHKKSFMYQDIEDKNSYLIISEWEDEAAFHSFVGSDTFRKVTNWGKEQILAGRPSHTTYHSGAAAGHGHSHGTPQGPGGGPHVTY